MFYRPMALFLAILLLSCTRSPERMVLATVDGEKIFASELIKAFEEQADSYDPEILNDPEGNLVVKKKILNGLIEEKVLSQTARDKGVTITPDEEKRLLTQLHSGYNPGEMERILQNKKISLQEWTEKQKRKKVVEKLIDQEVNASIRPTDQEIEDYYKKFRPLFREPDRIRCRQIVTSKRDKAETIRRLLEKDENFASVAQKYSESPDREKGGDLGYIARDEYPDIFIQACFSLATGQTSDVIPSPYGFHIFRVMDKRPGRQLSLPEVRKDIERRLRDERYRPALAAWLDKIYRDKKIAIDEKALKGVSLGVSTPPPETQETGGAETQRSNP